MTRKWNGLRWASGRAASPSGCPPKSYTTVISIVAGKNMSANGKYQATEKS